MATYSGWGYDETFKASVDMNSYQYRFVKTGSVAGEVAVCTAGAQAIGVLQNDPRAGEAATVRILGVSKVLCDASASPASWGGYIKSGSAGEAVGSVNFGASTYALGLALKEVLTGFATYTEVLLTPGVRV